MADRDQQTEAPTPKRRRDAVAKGDVLQSRELSTALVMGGGIAWLTLLGPATMAALQRTLRAGLVLDHRELVDFDPLHRTLAVVAPVVVPFFALAGLTLLGAVGAPALLGSLGFRASGFAPKPGKLDPLAGLKRIFGMQGWIEFAKSLLKLTLIAVAGWVAIRPAFHSLLASGGASPSAVAGLFGDAFLRLAIYLCAALALIGFVDAPIQYLRRLARLRMSKQEVKEEAKESDGNPENKRQAQARRHEILNGSARRTVTEANVILTNPTHFAVALRYRPGVDAAPVVVARGRGETALAIRELAAEAEVPRLEYPELTRAIYFTTRAGQPVAPDLYYAVATILAFVFNLDRLMAESQPAVVVPEDRRYDERGRRR